MAYNNQPPPAFAPHANANYSQQPPTMASAPGIPTAAVAYNQQQAAAAPYLPQAQAVPVPVNAPALQAVAAWQSQSRAVDEEAVFAFLRNQGVPRGLSQASRLLYFAGARRCSSHTAAPQPQYRSSPPSRVASHTTPVVPTHRIPACSVRVLLVGVRLWRQ